jgi:hypothetical protein
MHLQQRTKTLMNKLLNKKLKGDFIHFFFFVCMLFTLLHLPLLRFHCAGGMIGSILSWRILGSNPRMLGSNPGCWDRTQDAGIVPRMLGLNPGCWARTQGCWDQTHGCRDRTHGCWDHTSGCWDRTQGYWDQTQIKN